MSWADTEGDDHLTHYLLLAKDWGGRAEENIEEWGIQEPEVLLLVIMEELGEVTQAYLQAVWEDGDPEALMEELSDLAALMFQLHWSLQKNWPPEEGEQ